MSLLAALVVSSSLASAAVEGAAADPAAAPDDAVDGATASAPLPTVEELTASLIENGLDEDKARELAPILREEMAFERSLTPETGAMSISEGRATLHIPEGYGYLDPDEADRVLQAWGNPPGGGRDGMIISTEVSLFSAEGWAVLVSYDDMGHVDDEDAADIDWDGLLADKQASDEAANAQRRELGLTEVHLTGWAEPPHYDAERNRLYWASLLEATDGEKTVNYDVRVLGREGVLVMSAIADADAMAVLKPAMEDVITFGEFNAGHRYLDFDPQIDRVATAGLGTLVAGKVAAKTGMLAVIGAALLKAKKLLIVGLVAVAAAARRLFFGGAAPDTDAEG